jgi:hypothetical protein
MTRSKRHATPRHAKVQSHKSRTRTPQQLLLLSKQHRSHKSRHATPRHATPKSKVQSPKSRHATPKSKVTSPKSKATTQQTAPSNNCCFKTAYTLPYKNYTLYKPNNNTTSLTIWKSQESSRQPQTASFYHKCCGSPCVNQELCMLTDSDAKTRTCRDGHQQIFSQYRMVVYCTKASKWTSVQFALNKANHSAQHLNTPEAPPLQSANYLC